MATAQDIEQWEAFGGSVEEKTSGKRVHKTWFAPDGKKFRSWKEASAFMEADETKENRGSKRAQTSALATDETAKKRVKKDEGKQTAAKTPKTTANTGSHKRRAKGAAAIPVLGEEEQQPAADAADEAEPMDEDKQQGEQAGDDAADADSEQEAAKDDSEQHAEETEATSKAAANRSGRHAAQGKQYKEKNVGKGKKADEQVIKTEPEANTEAEALEKTKAEKDGRTRRLLQFSITDAQGDMQPLDRVGLLEQPLMIKGAVYPEDGALNKANGRLLSSPFGPITSWHVRYSSSAPAVVACTAKADYVLTKPVQQYKKVHAALDEQVNLTWHVLLAIDPELGGNLATSLDAVVAKLARAKAGKGYSSAREALLLNGRFVLGQVAAHEKTKGAANAAADKGKGKAPAGVTAGPFCAELEAELAKGPLQVGLVSGNAITIKDKQAAAAAAAEEPEKDALTAADEDMARRLQAKMDAQQMGAGGAKGRGRGSGAPYIKISEAEIADDYPMPQQYKVPDGVEETDELLLWDEELADCDPEYLPKRLITDFSIYNAEGFFASLELLPLWSGVDPDVELFASGIVKDDEGDWGTGGQPLELKHKSKQQQQQQGKDGVEAQKKEKGIVEKDKQPAAVAGGSSSGAGGSSAAAAAGASSAAAGGSSAAAAAGGGSSSGAGGSSSGADGPSAAAAGGSSAAAGGSSSAAAAGGSSRAGGSAAAPAAEDPAAEAAAAADDVAEDAGPDPVAEGGMRLYLSQIREWVVEYSADMLFISIRTDAAWYKLCRPNPQYKPWFGVPLKSARVAVKVIHALAEQSRASRMSFNDVVRMLAEAPTDSTTFISKRVDRVERYLVVHGQILLNQIKSFPNQAVQRSPFVSGLKEKMEQRKHSKLYYSQKGFSKVAKGVQRNPMKDHASSARAKPMPATATTMVRSIWQNYFYSMDERDDAVNKKKAEDAAKQGVAQEVDDDPDDEQDDDDKEENALAEAASPTKKKAAGSKSSKAGAGSSKAAAEAAAANVKPTALKVSWGSSLNMTDSNAGRQLYKSAQVGDWTVQLGAVVLLDAEQENQQQQEEEEEQQQHVFGLVQCMWQDEDGDRMAQICILVPGAETVLGDAGAEAELFVTDDFDDVLLSEVTGLANATRLKRDFDPDLRIRHFEADEELRKRNAAAKAAGQPLEYFYRHLYLPEQGMFKALSEKFGENLGKYIEEPAAPVTLAITEQKVREKTQKGFIKDGVTYMPGDFLFLLPDTYNESSESESDEQQSSESEHEQEEEGEGSKEKKTDDTPAYMNKKHRFHKGSIAGLRAWGIARLIEVQEAGSAKAKKDKKDAKPGKIMIQRFYRPEDISKDLAYKSEFWDVYASPEPPSSGRCEWVQWVDVDMVVRKCAARAVGGKVPEDAELLDMFEVKGTYNPTTKKVTAAPKEFTAAADQQQQEDDDTDVAMASMDIFAGCGGLSEGMHQAGVAATKWAIEYERPAADAFQLNNPDAAVFCNNCNVILLAAMQKAGLEKDASSCEDARAAVMNMPPEDIARLPLPGEVEFIMGGPPCQGYSGMNRFNKGNWSMVQNSMVMSYLSYADFYRPRYFLLENVRNFVSHNKSFTFRLTLRTLLDMGYQVRFGVLNAGNFGVAQSRKRTFIWAAAPDELLPEWPRPKHVFRSPQLTVNLPGGVAYCAVDTSVPGAPLRTVTVRDAIGDLPPIENGHSLDVMDYSGPPVSAFQRAMRSQAKQLRDHICKDMNPLNLERCRCIPKDTPGADWRVLVDIVKKDPSREKFQGQPLVPWCLPNTAARHNGWRGLFGRLDLDGHFPTSTTDPQPMGKVGQVFHPNQDRIVSVRECARSQGFPDHFFFSGNVHNRHRQVGNAVPPPLAASLGRQLNKALVQSLRKKQEGLTS